MGVKWRMSGSDMGRKCLWSEVPFADCGSWGEEYTHKVCASTVIPTELS